MKHKLESSEQSLVNVVYDVGGQYDNTGEPLNVVQQHTHINIGISVS